MSHGGVYCILRVSLCVLTDQLGACWEFAGVAVLRMHADLQQAAPWVLQLVLAAPGQGNLALARAAAAVTFVAAVQDQPTF